jgi:hypothetical protein
MVKIIEYDLWLESLMPIEETAQEEQEQEEEEREYPF